MNGKYPAEMLKHLEKESEVLMEAFRSMSHELHKLQVEEEMLMHKLFEQMQGQGAPEKKSLSLSLQFYYNPSRFSIVLQAVEKCFGLHGFGRDFTKLVGSKKKFPGWHLGYNS